MNKYLAAFVAAFVATSSADAAARKCPAQGDWDGTETLSGDSNYLLQWRQDGSDMVIALSAGTSGYLGFGIAEYSSGSMLGGDVIMYSNGVVRDYYVPWEAYPFAPYDSTFQISNDSAPVQTGNTLRPLRDCDNGGEDDWTLVSSNVDVKDNKPCTQIVLRRKLVTDDPENDRPFVPGPMRIIWALGETSATAYHGTQKRGGTMVTFMEYDAEMLEEVPQGIEPFDCSASDTVAGGADNCATMELMHSGYVIPPKETTYSCRAFELFPGVTDFSKHMVYMEEIVPELSSPYVHHVVVFGCMNGDPLPTDGLTETVECNSNSRCRNVIFAWAVGGAGIRLPDAAGFPVGDGPGEFRWVTIETHLTNPKGFVGVQDFSGVRLQITDTLREHNAGTIIIGQNDNHFDPPINVGENGDSFAHYQAGCPSVCTEGLPGSLNVFASLLHMHAFGRAIWSSRYDSEGDFKGYGNRIDYWNFEWQQLTPVKYTIEPGDHIQIHGVFDLSKWTDEGRNITFGEGSFEEMLLEVIQYYPVVPGFTSCGARVSANSPEDAMLTETSCPAMYPLPSNERIGYQRFDAESPDDPGTTIFPVFGTVNESPNDAECSVVGGDQVAGQATPSTDPNYEWMLDVFRGEGVLFWKASGPGSSYPDEPAGMSMRLEADRNSPSWLGFGISGQNKGNRMVNSRTIVGVPGRPVAEYLLAKANSDFFLTLNETCTDSSKYKHAQDVSSLEWAGSCIGDFTFTIRSDGNAWEEIVLARGPEGTGNGFMQHDYQQVLTLNWVSGQVVSGSTTNSNLAVARIIHACCMLGAFVLLFPLGIARATFRSHAAATDDAKTAQVENSKCSWVATHAFFNVSGFLVMVAGVVVIVMFIDPSRHATDPHHFLGFAVTGLAFLQPAAAICRPHHTPGESVSTSRKVWQGLHKLCGRLIHFGGLANCILGALLFQSFGLDYVVFLAVGAVGGVIAIALTVASVLRKSPSNQDSASSKGSLSKDSLDGAESGMALAVGKDMLAMDDGPRFRAPTL